METDYLGQSSTVWYKIEWKHPLRSDTSVLIRLSSEGEALCAQRHKTP